MLLIRWQLDDQLNLKLLSGHPITGEVKLFDKIINKLNIYVILNTLQ